MFVIAVRRHQNLTAQQGTTCQIEFRPILPALAAVIGSARAESGVASQYSTREWAQGLLAVALCMMAH
jgi:hypothetical protein